MPKIVRVVQGFYRKWTLSDLFPQNACSVAELFDLLTVSANLAVS
jgi:hypothetical protein